MLNTTRPVERTSNQVKPAFLSGHVRYVGDPDAVRRRYSKLPVKQVRGDWQVMAGIRGYPEFPFLPTAQPLFAANPFDAINPSMNTMISRFRLQPFRAIGLPRPFMRQFDFNRQSGILL